MHITKEPKQRQRRETQQAELSGHEAVMKGQTLNKVSEEEYVAEDLLHGFDTDKTIACF